MRTAQLRKEILDFKQHQTETFNDAWERFKKLLLQCPHHRISDDSLLRTFYSGIIFHNKRTLDAASKGSFMNKTTKEGWNLVENISTAERHCMPYEYHHGYETREHHSVCTLRINGTHKNIEPQRINHTQANSTPEIYTMFQQLLQSQSAVQASNTELNERISTLNTRIQNLEQRITNVENKQTITSSGQGKEDSTHSLTRATPMEDINAIQSFGLSEFQKAQGNQQNPDDEEWVLYNGKPTQKWVLDLLELEEDVAEDSNVQEGGACLQEAETVQNTKLPPQAKKEICSTSGNLEINHFHEYKGDLQKGESKSDDAITENSEQDEDSHEESDEEFVAKFIQEKKKREDLMITPNLPWIKKLPDPGTFSVSCSIGKMNFPKCMCDLGAEISTIPISIVAKLGLTNFKPGRVTIELADKSITECLGILEDVPVVVDNVIVPTDFAVLFMQNELTDPLLLGRPFLASANALIDCTTGTVQLRFSKFRMPTFTREGEVLDGTPQWEDSDKSLSEEDDDYPLEPLPLDEWNDNDIGYWSEKGSPRATEEINEFLDSEPEVMMLDVEPEECSEDELPFIKSPSSSLCPYPASLIKTATMTMPRHDALEKLDDPGPLTLPCSVADLHFPRCLCDTGSSVNIMPFSIAARIGFRNFPAKSVKMRLADQSKVESYGTLPSIPVEIAGVEVLTDFLVVKMTREPIYGLLLGRSFLRTTCADLDIMTGTVTLNLGTPNRTIFTRYGSVISSSPTGGGLPSDNPTSTSEEEGDQEENSKEKRGPDRLPVFP